MNIISPINQLGYGVAGLNITKELSKLTKVSLWPIGNPQITNSKDSKIVKNCIENAEFFDYDDPCIRIWHQHDMSQFVGNGEHIGFPIFELDTFTPRERHHLNSCDRLFVCSQWAKEICLINGIKPRKASLHNDAIDIVPLGVDLEIFKPCNINNGATIFFNCGKWEVRKGHDILVEIFNEAFDESDNVELWMMCENPFLTSEEDKNWKRLYANSKLGSKVRFINRVNTQDEVYNIMNKVDCGIFPSKAEGWNLELLELMACGKHVITTNYSAHTEFCNSANAHLVDIKEKELANDGKWFKNNGSWAKISTEQIKQFALYMKNLHENKQAGTMSLNQEGITTSNYFTWETTARKILQYV